MSKALHVVDATMFWSPTGGGVRRYLLAKHAWLALRPGWRHTVAVPGSPPPGSEAARLPALPLPGSGGYRLPVSRAAVARVLERLQPDLIEAGDPYRVAWGALDAARALGIPVIATCHSNLEAMARMAGGRWLGAGAARVARRYARRLYDRFELVLAPSRSLQAHLLDWGVGQVALQPLGVDAGRFHPRHADASWRAGLGLADDARVLVYAGRFAPEKHLEVLVDAVRRLGDPYVLVVIGAGPTPPLAGPRVRVLPFVADVEGLARVLASADAFVHAGDQETFGLSALEAMACGTPVVLRAAEGLAELADGGAGIGIADGSGTAFAEGIAALFDGDEAAHAARRIAARERAEANDWERVLPELLERYSALIDGRRRGDAAPLSSELRAATAPPAP